MSILEVYLTAFLFLSCSVGLARDKVSVDNLRCETKVDPIGIAELNPRFSWQIHSTGRDVRQFSYRILVSDSREKLQNEVGDCWDSKVSESDRSVEVPYEGLPLRAEKQYFWKVIITDRSGQGSDWSETASFTMGLMTTQDWGGARWIGYANLPDSMRIVPGVHGYGDQLGKRGVGRSVVPIFRKEFEVTGKISSATLYISGLGQYEASLNGEKVGRGFLTPGWTDYDKTTLYNAYDLTSQLRQGKNVLGVLVGNGFYNINRERYRKLVVAYGYPKMISKLKIFYKDGNSSEVVSGTDWKCAPSPILFSSIYGGEDWDATLEQQGWDQTGFDDSNWKPAVRAAVPAGKLAPEMDHPVAVNREIPVKKIEQRSMGKFLYDFGQNCSGIIELKVRGKKGSVVKLTPGELITANKEVNQKATGAPFYYSYTLKGDGVEVWRPKFSYYGFRYVMAEGAVPVQDDKGSGLPQIVGMTMLHTCNSSAKTGEFSCSNELFNRIYSLIDWAIRSNLQSVVTDCPHREKLGWLEQTYLMGASLHYNYDLHELYRKAVGDMMDAQTSTGLVPDIAPEYVRFAGGFRDSPEWGSAAILLPWLLWEWYGDRSILEKAMPMMQRYVAYLGSQATGNILSYGLGDWFDYGPKSPGEAQLTPKALTATAIYYYDIRLLSRMMSICNRESDAEKMTQLANEVKTSFNDKFFDAKTKIYSTGSQTAMAMPVVVGLVDEKDKKEVLNNLVSSISKSGNALTAGDVGFHFLVKALEENGGSQVLFDMNCRDDQPGYGFQLKKGATALTESWPALKEVSNNHLMLGHLMEWFYTGLGGIRQAEGSVAFKHIVIRPEIVGDITFVSTSYLSAYGMIRSDWKRTNGKLEMNVEIPANADATIWFPVKDGVQVTESGKNIVLSKSPEGNYCCRVGSGAYRFKMIY